MTGFARSFGQPLQQGSYELGHPADVLRVGNVRSAGWNVADPAADGLPSSRSASRTEKPKHRHRCAHNSLAMPQSALHLAGRRLQRFVGDHPLKAALGATVVGRVLLRWLVSVVRQSIRTMLRNW